MFGTSTSRMFAIYNGNTEIKDHIGIAKDKNSDSKIIESVDRSIQESQTAIELQHYETALNLLQKRTDLASELVREQLEKAGVKGQALLQNLDNYSQSFHPRTTAEYERAKKGTVEIVIARECVDQINLVKAKGDIDQQMKLLKQARYWLTQAATSPAILVEIAKATPGHTGFLKDIIISEPLSDELVSLYDQLNDVSKGDYWLRIANCLRYPCLVTPVAKSSNLKRPLSNLSKCTDPVTKSLIYKDRTDGAYVFLRQIPDSMDINKGIPDKLFIKPKKFRPFKNLSLFTDPQTSSLVYVDKTDGAYVFVRKIPDSMDTDEELGILDELFTRPKASLPQKFSPI